MKNIKDFINEASINAKKRDLKFAKNLYIKGTKIDNIGSFGIITAENPDSHELSKPENKKLMMQFAKTIKTNGYRNVRIDGHFGGNVEHSYIIFNIKLDTLKYYAGLYEQTSFFYCYPTDTGIMSEYWEKADTTKPYDSVKNDYILINKTTVWTNEKNAEDNFSIIGGDFKYSIDPSVFSKEAEHMNECLNKIDSTLSHDELIDYVVNGVGEKPSYFRNIVNS